MGPRYTACIIILCEVLVCGVFGNGVLNEGLGGADIDVKLLKFAKCREYKERLGIEYREIKIERKGKDKYALKGIIDINEVLEDPIKFEYNISKCKDINKPDSCQLYTSYDSKDACQELENGKGHLKSIFESCNATVKCPVQKNSFKIGGYDIDVPPEGKAMAAVGRYFKVRVIGFHKEKCLTCMDVSVEINHKERSKKKG